MHSAEPETDSARAEPEQRQIDYLIVGAGPAGLQMAYFLQRAGRDYVVLEARSHCCGFFDEYPRHGQLISINKLHNYFKEEEFNMRHDWNSLLTDDGNPELKFGRHSSELYPRAVDMTHYMRDFAAKTALNIRYNSRVRLIDRAATGAASHPRFVVTLEDGAKFVARVVLMATGATRENLPECMEGCEVVETYGTHDINREKYNNKRVCIIGGGNSAFETANHIAGNAAVVHIFMGHELRLAWNTHYVGDVRAINNTIIDMYQLKSLHAVLGSRAERFEKLPNGNVLVHFADLDTHWDVPGRLRFAVEYEHVILCCGFKYINEELFAPALRPNTMRHGRYPKLNSIWETDISNLFYIGTAMAATDRKASSGFIHGFRYNIRTLFQLLEERLHGVPLPYTVLDRSLDAVADKWIERFSVSDEIYQMYSVLGDVMVVDDDEVRYYRGLPIKHVMQRDDFASKQHVFVVFMDYGFHKFAGVPADNVHAPDFLKSRCAPFIHPIVHYYSCGTKRDELELQESLVVRFDAISCDTFPQWPWRTNSNFIKSFVNDKVKWTDEQFDLQIFPTEMLRRAFTPLTDEERARIPRNPDPSKPCKASTELLPAPEGEQHDADAPPPSLSSHSVQLMSKPVDSDHEDTTEMERSKAAHGRPAAAPAAAAVTPATPSSAIVAGV